MAWKIYITCIKNVGKVEITHELINSLGFKDFEYTEKTTFWANPQIGEIYITNWNNHLLIAHRDLYWLLQQEPLSIVKEKFMSKYSNTSIISIIISYITSFVIFENGQKIRLQEVGDEVYQDIGEHLPEEINLIKSNFFELILKELQEDELNPSEIEKVYHTELAYQTAFEITKRIFGKRYDELDLIDYQLDCVKYKNYLVKEEQDFFTQLAVQFQQ